MVGVLMELGVLDPVPAPNAPAVSYQLTQGVWGGAQAGKEQAARPRWLAITASIGVYPYDQAGTDPGLANVLWRLFSPQRPGDVAAMADLAIHCHERDLALSLDLRSDLAVQRLLVGFDC